jgi:hypothetical protein
MTVICILHDIGLSYDRVWTVQTESALSGGCPPSRKGGGIKEGNFQSSYASRWLASRHFARQAYIRLSVPLSLDWRTTSKAPPQAAFAC